MAKQSCPKATRNPHYGPLKLKGLKLIPRGTELLAVELFEGIARIAEKTKKPRKVKK